ncbi:hypothetical protein, conserved [Plasmodium gonderi]|uniref:Uncharacterized protein n=1 Tax=Plasmodium gonderi TaxID=77519 RepID=A0A1Y1JH19_PLAGO|nr:hypothetical protein, conserved [Plasmodium gonderi]GAW81540.1 hypothetical protein, conserved [Plasmodium gonderi]
MKYIFTIFSMFIILLVKGKSCINDYKNEQKHEYHIFISNILINNVYFTFDKDRYHYELEANKYITEISVSPLLNIWENYIYKKISLEDEMFFNENTVQYLDSMQNVRVEELYLKKYHIYINKKKVYFSDLPYNIQLMDMGEKQISIFYENNKTYEIKIRNNNKYTSYYLNDVNITGRLSDTNLILDKEFKNYIYIYTTNVQENEEELNVQAKCYNSETYINNNLIKNKSFVFPLNPNVYNNILVIECRHQQVLEKTQLINKKKNNISENFIKRKFQESILRNSQKWYKEIPFLDNLIRNHHKFLDKQSSYKKDDKNNPPHQDSVYKKRITNSNELYYKPNKKENFQINKIFRKFYFFNIFYHVTIKIPNYMYNLTYGNTCLLDNKKNTKHIREYFCNNFNKNISLYSDISNKLFSFVKVDNQNMIYRFIDKVLNGSIHYSTNIYLYLETYYDKKVVKLKFKKKNTFIFPFLILPLLALVVLFSFIAAIYWCKFYPYNDKCTAF